MATSDFAHRRTDEELEALEKRIAHVYREAAGDLDETIRSYFDSFRKRDEAMRKMVEAGEVAKEQYTQWRINQIGRGERFQALRDQLAERYTRANETAVSYVNDATPGIYVLNRNYAAYTIERVAGDIGFTLWDERTVKRLIVDEPDSMPYYPPERAVKRGIDLDYGKKQITASVTSSILQGKSVKGMADDLQARIPTMNRDSAIRTARTAVTGAQNAGRMDSYAAAQKRGILLQKEWLATLDGRTRHSHAMLDGEKIDNDKKFSNGCMFPGDPSGPPGEIYNCRCTLIAAVEGVDTSDAQRRARSPETGEGVLIEDMTYQEWAGWKQGKGADSGGGAMPGVPELVDRVDFSDEKAVLSRLKEAEKKLAGLDYEVNYSITTDGKVWRVSGESGSVNPSAIPSSLKGSYSYHNHPAEKTNYSFSAEDAAFFISSGEAVSMASDDLYEYTMRRRKATLEENPDKVYYKFKQIEKTKVYQMMWDGEIDPDLDKYHTVMEILSRELNFEYERKKKDK